MAAKRPVFRNLFEELGIAKESVIQFSFGAPSLTILSKLKPIFAEATRSRLETEKTGQMFQYGAFRGDLLYVQELAKFLSKCYNDPVCSDNLLCTGGATNGLLLLSTLVLKSGDYIFVEDPTYFIAIQFFQKDLNMNIVVVPMDDEGDVDIGAFDKMLTEYSEKLGTANEERLYRAMFYTIPVFQNPTTRLLPEGKCAALIKVLRKHNILAVCDDVYNIIHFGNNPPKRLFSYDKETDSDYKGHVVSNGSFSKIVGPGMRLGWLEAPDIVINKIICSGYFKSGGGVNQYASAIMGQALQNGTLSEHIEDIVKIYQSKMEMLCEALDEHMKPVIHYTKPKGGYFIWIELLVDCDVEAFQRYSMINHHVNFQPGPCFSVNRNFKNCIRLSFAYAEKDEIAKGIKELALAFKNFLKE